MLQLRLFLEDRRKLIDTINYLLVSIISITPGINTSKQILKVLWTVDIRISAESERYMHIFMRVNTVS